MVYHGCVRNGMVMLDPGVQLAEGTFVIVQTSDITSAAPADDAVYRLGELAAPAGIADLAANIDHYLYDHPKVTDAQS